ncbi:hypothetical protein DFO62_106253 [Serratia fonticola]|nr:hypothetical protein DFO62_106253 [Serratia fonticola]
MNKSDKDESQKQSELWEGNIWKGNKETIRSSKTPFKDFFSIVGFLFVSIIILHLLLGNVEIGKLSFGHNDFFGYFIRYNI